MSRLEWLKPAWIRGDNLLQIVPVLAGKDRKLRLFALACCDRVRHRITDPRSLAAVAFAERYAETCGVRGRKGRPAVAAAAEAATAEFVAQQVHTRLDLPLGIRIIACQVAAQLVDGDGLKSAVVVSSCAPQLRLLEWALADGHQYDWQSPVIQDANRTIQAGFVALLRDVAGDPYRPVAFDPPWLTST